MLWISEGFHSQRHILFLAWGRWTEGLSGHISVKIGEGGTGKIRVQKARGEIDQVSPFTSLTYSWKHFALLWRERFACSVLLLNFLASIPCDETKFQVVLLVLHDEFAFFSPLESLQNSLSCLCCSEINPMFLVSLAGLPISLLKPKMPAVYLFLCTILNKCTLSPLLDWIIIWSY